MAIMKVKAGPKAAPDSDGAVLWVEKGAADGGLALITNDGKPVEVDGRHKDIKAALREGILVEVKGGKKEDEKGT